MSDRPSFDNDGVVRGRQAFLLHATSMEGRKWRLDSTRQTELPAARMSRKTRREERLLKEQDTIGMQRAERKYLAEITGLKKVAGTRPNSDLPPSEDEAATSKRPRRQARPGKPLKR